MENHLFLLELFVETISFSSNLPEYPLLQDVKVTASMGDYVNIEIVSLQTPSGSKFREALTQVFVKCVFQ